MATKFSRGLTYGDAKLTMESHDSYHVTIRGYVSKRKLNTLFYKAYTTNHQSWQGGDILRQKARHGVT